MASSTENPPHHLSAGAATPFTATAAPPPTPSNHPSLPTHPSPSDFLSHLLHRLPPSLSLSLPSRRPSSAVVTPPLISLFDDSSASLLSAATQHGFFHLADHRIPLPLPSAAESAAISLLALPDDRKMDLFPANWPLGHDAAVEDHPESLCLDSSELEPGPLREFAAEMERIGVEVVKELAAAAGFDSPDRETLRCLTWISDARPGKPGRIYPYVVGVHYQIGSQNQTVMSDSGWANVSGRANSVLITVGDIAQVWSNAKLKKVRGIPIPSSNNDDDNNKNCITISLLITLPIENIVSPRISNLIEIDEHDDDQIKDSRGIKKVFTSFSLEDYAWRVYHDHLLLKDHLIRYRI